MAAAVSALPPAAATLARLLTAFCGGGVRMALRWEQRALQREAVPSPAGRA